MSNIRLRKKRMLPTPIIRFGKYLSDLALSESEIFRGSLSLYTNPLALIMSQSNAYQASADPNFYFHFPEAKTIPENPSIRQRISVWMNNRRQVSAAKTLMHACYITEFCNGVRTAADETELRSILKLTCGAFALGLIIDPIILIPLAYNISMINFFSVLDKPDSSNIRERAAELIKIVNDPKAIEILEAVIKRCDREQLFLPPKRL